MKKIIYTAALFMVTMILLTGCLNTDVVQKYSVSSFKDIAQTYPELITDNTMDDHYYYLTVDGETTLKISHDYDLTTTEDISIRTPLKPFTDAGLDISKLGNGYKIDKDMFYVTGDYGNGSGMEDTITDSLFESVVSNRGVLSYHKKLDHYGIALEKGKFEFAKNYKNNDKDIVFVLQAKPLADMGADVQKIDGWIFATLQDEDGSSIDVLLKPYDLGSK